MDQSIAQSVRFSRLMGYFLLPTVPAYFLCAEFLSPNQEKAIDPVIKNVLTVIALSVFVVVPMLRYRFLPDLSRATSPAEVGGMVGRFRKVTVLGMTLSESVALYGLLLRILGASRNYTLPFYLLAALGILLFLRGLPSGTDGMRG